VARRAPVQQRSIESMNRMLDAGEQLFYEGGSPALTLEAVIERADTSTGSFYARFGDMHGFLDAMHERVLQTVSAELLPVLAKAGMEPDLESAMRTAFTGAFAVIERHRVPLYFFAVGNSHDRTWREMGSRFTVGVNETYIKLIKSYLPTFTSAAAKRRIEIASRMSIATIFQQIMLDQTEFSTVNLSTKLVATEFADMVCTYLRATPSK
jgi:AcrR family transcriptional regulator